VENHVQLSAAILAGGQARRSGAGGILIVGTSAASGQGPDAGNGVGSRFDDADPKRLPTPFPRIPGSS